MKIIMVGFFPPHLGGVASHTYQLSQQLVDRGDKVQVITYPHPEIRDIDKIKVKSAFTLNIPGLRGLIFLVTATLKLLYIICREDADIIHAHFILPPGLVAVLVGILTGKKVVVTAHGSDLRIQTSNHFLKPIIKFILSRAYLVGVVNEDLRRRVLDLNIEGVEKKLRITPNAVDLTKYHPQTRTDFRRKMQIPEKDKLILFVGNLVPQKGVEYLLEAKKLLKTDSNLIIVGDGPLLTELQDKVKQENIRQVFFTGARRDVPQILPAADIVVLPSISEGSPYILLEALACGKPVIATKVGGIPDMVTPDEGLLVEPGDPKSLAKAIDKLLNNPKLLKDMGRKSRKKAENFSRIPLIY